jgi:3-deoxy-D-manno-octulosonate 8-phosphate phosphatase (KDO 8-P phosphatase)
MNILEQFGGIQTFIFDVDGVFTDGRIMLTESGEMLRTVSTKDSCVLRKAVDAGYRICIITYGNSKGVEQFFERLGIYDIFSNVRDKVAAYQQYVDSHDLDPATILYMGDDLNDYGVLRLVGLPTCPADAVPEIQAVAQYISPIKGGDGCAREVIEKVMKLQGKWQF